MPPKARTPEMLKRDRQRIIDQAAQLIQRHGLEGFTMRRLSTKLNMSATNIYNYFCNKDEIYLHILIVGFNLLKKEQDRAIEQVESPLQKLESFLGAMVQFGIKHPAYYQLMFNTQDPKSLDYQTTSFADLARKEKAIAMDRFNALFQLTSLCNEGAPEAMIETLVTQILCQLHGMVTLFHSNILAELDTTLDFCFSSLIENIHLLLKVQQESIQNSV